MDGILGGSKLQFLALQRLEHRQDGLFVELQIVHDDMHHTRRRGLRFEGQEGVNHSAENVLENASKRASACASLLFCFASIFCFLTEPCSWPLAEPGWLSSVPECPAWLPEAAICCPRRSSSCRAARSSCLALPPMSIRSQSGRSRMS